MLTGSLYDIAHLSPVGVLAAVKATLSAIYAECATESDEDGEVVV